MKRNVTPEKAVMEQFPLRVKKGNVTVKIYEVTNRNRKLYTVTYLTASAGRVRRSFTDLALAKAEAETIAHNLNSGDLEALKLTGADKQLYTEAQRAIARTGASLIVVANEYARAWDILGHGGIVEAARHYRKTVETGLPDVTVAEAVAKFAEAKKTEGKSNLYLKDIRLYLGKFATHFRCNLATIQPDDLRQYLGGLNVGPVATNNHRRLLVALFNFAKKNRWLHADRETAAEALDAYKVKEREVEIFTPAEVACLLVHAEKDFLPWIALIAFGGVRNEELAKGLIWESINFNRGYLIIPGSIAKTNRKRKIDLPENLLLWLAPYRNKKGPIFKRDFRKPLARTCRKAGVTWKRNALRHSFGSYRLEQVKNEGQVALEMGNSPAMVKRHYAEIVEGDAAAEYWNIRPVKRGDRKIVTLR
jgi:site-specific recombinase XerD